MKAWSIGSRGSIHRATSYSDRWRQPAESATTPKSPQVAETFTPSLQLAPVPVQQQQMQQSPEQQPLVGAGASLAEVAAFIRGERDESRKEREEWKARLDQQREESEAQRRALEGEMASKMEQQAAVQTERQLPALQSRLESLHAANLLTDEELYRLEDIIADSLEDEQAGGGGAQVTKLVVLSGRMAGDAALARQLRRKFA